MSDQTYKIVFEGQLREGFSVEDVKAGMARLFNLGPENLERLFSGNRVVIRSGLGREEALKYRKAILKTGAECKVLLEKPALGMEVPDSAASSAGATRKPVDLNKLVREYRGKCKTPPCFWVSDMSKEMSEEIALKWSSKTRGQRVLAWFEVDRLPDGAYGLLLTNSHLHVRSVTSGARSIPIAEVESIQIVQVEKKMDLELGPLYLFRDIPNRAGRHLAGVYFLLL